MMKATLARRTSVSPLTMSSSPVSLEFARTSARSTPATTPASWQISTWRMRDWEPALVQTVFQVITKERNMKGVLTKSKNVIQATKQRMKGLVKSSSATIVSR